jgi:hypothetical protein
MALTFDKASLNKQFEQFKEFKEKMIEKYVAAFEYTGEQFVNDAKDSGSYKDRTGNLRSSIGYIVALDGQIKSQKFEVSGKGTDGEKGKREGLQFAREIIGSRMGLILVGVAGMEYASALEAKGYEVISVSARYAGFKLNERIEKIK